jgi:hypothetical protein
MTWRLAEERRKGQGGGDSAPPGRRWSGTAAGAYGRERLVLDGAAGGIVPDLIYGGAPGTWGESVTTLISFTRRNCSSLHRKMAAWLTMAEARWRASIIFTR